MSTSLRISLFLLAASLSPAVPAAAQDAAPAPPTGPAVPHQAVSYRPERPWSFDFGMGWDSSLSGNINSGAIGVLNGRSTVVLRNRYEDAYGTGLYLHFAGGYKIAEMNELRASLTFQRTTADLVVLGDIGTSKLYGQYDPYKSLTLDVGFRRYAPTSSQAVRFYAEGLIGLGFISEIDVNMAAPGANIIFDATDFYDRTAAFTMSAHAGAIVKMHERVDLNARIGMRYMTGMSRVDAFRGTGLEPINEGSGRWTVPFILGVSFRF